MSSGFFHLSVHSEYSIINSTIRINQLVEKAKDMGFSSMALTDHANFFAAVKFYDACVKNKIKPVLGIDVAVSVDQLHYRCVLLAKNIGGYRALCEVLTSRYGQTHDSTHVVDIPLVDLENSSQDVLCILVGADAPIAQELSEGHYVAVKNTLNAFSEIFDNRFYLGIKRNCEADEQFNRQLFKWMVGSEESFALVAIGDVYFLESHQHSSHATRVCIQEGSLLSDQKKSLYDASQYLKSSSQMCALFQDIPACIENTHEVIKRCNLKMDLGKTHLPNIGQSKTQSNQILQQKVLDALCKYLEKNPEFNGALYEKRALYEVGIIEKTGYSDYFLIVADFVGWAKSKNIPVGPGRGSGAGSLVAYLLQITDIDPVVYGLLFERFLNIDRVSMPDFDIDFCPIRRDEVIDYVTKKYGEDRVAQIITFGSMAAKAVIRDVGRVLGLAYGFVDEIASLVPFEIDITLDKAMKDEPLIQKKYDEDETVRTLIDLSKELEGLKRNIGKHAGGVVISPQAMTNFLALYKESPEGRFVSQLDKDDLERVGLVKFDFLGLKNLTIIQDALISLHEMGEEINLDAIALDDKQTFQMICQGRTQGVFQLESRGMRDIILQLQPDCLEEIIDLCALYRPGPIESGMIDNYIAYKKNKKALDVHPLVAPILESTKGVILYQEQVMRIAQVLAGYSLGQADILRRIMGKKKYDQMQEQRAVFIKGAEKNNVDAKHASDIFDLIDKFAGYGFNKSHSAAYGLIAYQTAYLKANFTSYFMAAVLSHSMEKLDRLMVLMHESNAMGVVVNALSIHESYYRFKANDSRAVSYGMGAVKGLGQSFVEKILEVRSEKPFEGLEDFCSRVPLPDFGVRGLSALIESGSVDSFGVSREKLIFNINRIMQFSRQHHHDQGNAQSNLWGAEQTPLCFEQVPEGFFAPYELQIREYNLLGQFLTQHPLLSFSKELDIFSITDFSKAKNASQMLLWLIKKTQQTGRNKQSLAVLILEDARGNKQEFLMDAEHWSEHNPSAHAPFVVDLTRNQKGRLFIKNLQTLENWQSEQKGLLELWLDDCDEKYLNEVKKALHQTNPGQYKVLVHTDCKLANAQVSILLKHKIALNQAAVRALKCILGQQNIQVHYRNFLK